MTNGQPPSLQPILEVEDKEGRPVETVTHKNHKHIQTETPVEEQPSNHNSASMEDDIQVDSDNGIKGGEANLDKEGIGLCLSLSSSTFFIRSFEVPKPALTKQVKPSFY